MDFELYQSLQQQQRQEQSMNFYSSPFHQSLHGHQQQQHHEQRYLQQQQQQQHDAMIAASYINPSLWSMSSNPFSTINYRNFLNSQRHHHQQQCYRRHNSFPQQRRPFNLPSFFDPTVAAASSSSMMMPTTTPSPSSPFTHSSSDGSIREETVREVFYRVLSESLKEANKFFCGKTTSWKNPFLYKTTLCVNYTNRSYCRFGVNCWYAHGYHELRCIPESEELPEPTYIKQYLSFLGLPSNTLDQIIQRAYFVASLFTSEAGSKKSSSTHSSLIRTRSTSPSLHSPIESHCQSSFSAAVAPPPPPPTTFSDSMNPSTQQCISNSNNKFLSSLASNGGWGDIESAINGAVNDKEEDESPFGKGYHLFGNSFNLQKSW